MSDDFGVRIILIQPPLEKGGRFHITSSTGTTRSTIATRYQLCIGAIAAAPSSKWSCASSTAACLSNPRRFYSAVEPMATVDGFRNLLNHLGPGMDQTPRLYIYICSGINMYIYIYYSTKLHWCSSDFWSINRITHHEPCIWKISIFGILVWQSGVGVLPAESGTKWY